MIKVDYSCGNIVNLMATIMVAYGAKSPHRPLAALNSEKLKNNRNIIFIVFDGLGYNLLRNSDAHFLKSKIQARLQTVFPSTTTTAMTTFYTGLTPAEHSMLGWSLYYSQYSLLADVLPKWDSATLAKLGDDYYLLDDMPEENIFLKIRKVRKDVNTHFIAPEGIDKTDFTKKATRPSNIYVYKEIEELPDVIKMVIDESNGPNFIFIYSDLPDEVEHGHGVNSEKTVSVMRRIDGVVSEISRNLANDSIVLITADHGLVDVQQDYINQDMELYDLISMPVYPEPRFFSLFLKDYPKPLPEGILKRYEEWYYIFTRNEFIDSRLLGPGSRKETFKHIGDYVFIGKAGHAMMNYRTNGFNPTLKAHHAGLTEDEMYVPLIMI